MNSVVLQLIKSGNLLGISFSIGNNTLPKKNHVQTLGLSESQNYFLVESKWLQPTT
jgi:hypothetical protein